MKYHIITRHPNEHKKLENTGLLKNNEKIHSYMKKTADWRPNGKKSIAMQRKVVMFVLGTNQSLSIVDNPLFCASMPDDFIPLSRKKFTNVSLPTAYENTKEKLLYVQNFVACSKLSKILNLSEKTTRIVKTAAMLDPKHIRFSYQSEIEINEFIDHIVQIAQADNTIDNESETQMIGPSQPPVSLNVNIPKTQ